MHKAIILILFSQTSLADVNDGQGGQRCTITTPKLHFVESPLRAEVVFDYRCVDSLQNIVFLPKDACNVPGHRVEEADEFLDPIPSIDDF